MNTTPLSFLYEEEEEDQQQQVPTCSIQQMHLRLCRIETRIMHMKMWILYMIIVALIILTLILTMLLCRTK